MKDDESLSDKIHRTEDEDTLQAGDVREAVKKLKEKISEWHESSFKLDVVIEDIDSIFGPDLTLKGGEDDGN